MKYTEKKAASIVNHILRDVRKTPYVALYDTWEDNEGRTIACDGFRAFRFVAEPAGVDHIESNWPRGVDLNGHYFSVLDEKRDVIEIQTPSAADVKSFISGRRGARGAWKAEYDLGHCLPLVNPYYLRDALNVFPGAKWYVYADVQRRMVSPVFFECECGSGCILPIRSERKRAEAMEATSNA